ncbi:leukocyte receptor cluster member 1-like [Phoca vitulina]|uniref:leukocyte receptor cluster member 1-like n=1 Tax=Phoca vitulina TaxID=9720 RepID=UPI0013962F1E|nr:leukocyte receptor cluster member 1-like [Phoca vitulina]
MGTSPLALGQLRAERLRREATERARAEALLARVRGTAPQKDQPEEEADERRRPYNSQFNPQWARRPAGNAQSLTDCWGERRGRSCQPSYKTIYS